MNAPEPRIIIRPRMALLAGSASLVAVTILIAIKYFAYAQTGAVSVLATLIDSGVDASVSLMTFLAIRLSLKPADTEHRFGHGKVEGLAALLQAMLITGAGFFLLFEALDRFTSGYEIANELTAIAVMGVSIFISAVLVAIQKYTLRLAPSLAVEADKTHYAMDIVVNVMVIAVMLVVYFGGPAWPDPFLALLVTIYLAITAKDIAGRGLDMIFDREIPGDAREVITKKVLSHSRVLGMHDLRTRQSGMQAFISFDIEVDADLSLRDAHEIAREVEHSLLADFPQADIIIHVDPSGDVEDSRHQVAGVHH